MLPGASDATHFIRSTVDFCQLAVIELDCHCAREPPPRPTPQAHVSRDSNLDFNPDPDSRCLPDRSNNVLDSFSCQHPPFRHVS